MGQLSLSVQLKDDANLANFYPGANQQAFNQLQLWLQGQGDPMIYLWGPSGVGRSHLLQACCKQASQQGLAAAFIPLSLAHELAPALLENVEQMDVVCIDDIDAVAGLSVWEEALFHLYNLLQQRGTRLLMSASSSPINSPLQLADLRSRLSAAMCFQLTALDESQQLAALQWRARYRGLEVSHEVGQFLQRRCQRNMASLCEALEQLDKASLVAQRRLSIPFIKQILSL